MPGSDRPSAPSAIFDAHAVDYDSVLNRGLSVTGESRDFFARGRIAWIQKSLTEDNFIPRTVLDLGCGTGATTPFLLNAWSPTSLIGIDVSAESIREARKHHASPVARFEMSGDITPQHDRDLVYCNGVFHHMPPAERLPVLDYVSDWLSPGGVLAFCENNPWNPGTRYVMKRLPFDRDAQPLSIVEARRLLRRGGFQVLGSGFLFFFPRFLSLLRPLESRLAGVPLGGQYIVLARKGERRSSPSPPPH